MVTEKALLSNRYKFKHIKVEVLEKDENDNVMVFSATFVTTKLPGQAMSDGHIEINRTLWDQQSTKRPPGYWIYNSYEKDGVMKSVFVSEEWLETTPKAVKAEKESEWKL